MTIQKPLIQKCGVLLLAVLLPVLFMLAALQIVNHQDYVNSDFFTFWMGGRLIFTGGDPYSVQDWMPGYGLIGATWMPTRLFVYPLPLAVLFAPLGAMPYHLAYVVWVSFSQAAILVSILLLLATYHGKNPRFAYLFAFVGVLIFRPTYLVLRNGQPGAMLLLALCVCVLLWERGRWFWGGAALALMIVKPQIGAPVQLFLLVWVLVNRKWSALAGMALSALMLAGLGWIHSPGWMAAFLQNCFLELNEHFGIAPTLWGVSARLCNYQVNWAQQWSIALAALLLVGWVVFALFARRRNLPPRPAAAAGLCAALGLLVTPYMLSYDQVILILPAAVLVLALQKRRAPFLLWSSVFILYAALSWALVGLALQLTSDVWSVTLTLVALLMAGAGARLFTSPPACDE